LIGVRPIISLEGFKSFGVTLNNRHSYFCNAQADNELPTYTRIMLEYPSVGATENLLMLPVWLKEKLYYQCRP